MPVHDWTRVDAGIFHALRHGWMTELARALNRSVLPPDYYALPEQHAAGFGPDVLTLAGPSRPEAGPGPAFARSGGGTGLLAPPKQAPVVAPAGETDMAFYRRKQTPVVVRHVSGDEVVAMIEVVSPGNKSARHAMRSFVEKAAELIDRRIQLLILDLLPPGPRDPQGIHAAVWEEIAGQGYDPPADRPLTLAAYESGLSIRAYVRHVAPGDELPEMPLYLETEAWVPVPLAATYDAAFAGLPARWQRVLQAPAPTS